MGGPYSHIHAGLASDGFNEIGRFAIEAYRLKFEFTLPEAQEWVHSVYAWVGLVPPATVVRIGKCQWPLRTRIEAFRRSLDQVMSGGLRPNECFKGDTTPRERDGWIGHASAPHGGLIFACRHREATLRETELRLIRAYDPPLCN